MKDMIMTFESVHHTLKAEKALRLAGFDAVAINTPRRLSSDCGISLKFAAGKVAAIQGTLNEENIAWRGCYEYNE